MLLNDSDNEKKSALKKQHGRVIVEKVLLEWNFVSMCPSPSLQPLHIACLDSKSTSFWSFCLPIAYYFAMHHVASRQLNCFFTLCKPFNFFGILQKLGSLWTQWPKWHHFPQKVQQGTILVVKLKGKNISPVTYGCRGTGRRKWFVKLYLQWTSEVKNGQGLQILRFRILSEKLTRVILFDATPPSHLLPHDFPSTPCHPRISEILILWPKLEWN